MHCDQGCENTNQAPMGFTMPAMPDQAAQECRQEFECAGEQQVIRHQHVVRHQHNVINEYDVVHEHDINYHDVVRERHVVRHNDCTTHRPDYCCNSNWPRRRPPAVRRRFW